MIFFVLIAILFASLCVGKWIDNKVYSEHCYSEEDCKKNIDNKNCIILSNPTRLCFGNIDFYILKIKYENRNLPEILNVKGCDIWIYKKNNDEFDCIFSHNKILKNKQKKYIIPIKSDISDYYFFFVQAKVATSKNECTFFTNPQTGENYTRNFIIANDKTGYIIVNNLGKIIGINQYMECLYTAISDKNYDYNLYLWKPECGVSLIAENLKYGESYHYYGFNFKKFKDIQFDLFEDDNVCIYFYKKECNSFYILIELCKQNDIDIEILPNKFEDDINTVNYKIKINKKNIELIGLIYYCLDRVHTPYSNINALSYGLYDNNKKANTCGGSAVYNIPFMDYYKGIDGKFKIYNAIAQHSLTKEQRQNFKNIVNNIYQKYHISPDYNNLPKEFISTLICEDLLYIKLREFLEKKFTKTHEIYNFKTLDDVLREKYKDRYNLIKQDLIARKIIKSKWKSELELFRLVYKYYPDAIYQYRADWLGLQSLDIYIPSLKIGIEYQGEQHYKPIEHFGGEAAFLKRQELDQRKKKLCTENNVCLIEWKFDEAVSKLNLDKKIKEAAPILSII